MPKMIASSRVLYKTRLASFTLIELLTVMAIIAILAALTLGAASGVMNKAARSRAAGEIQGMSTALESYKTDNGAYPTVNVATGFVMPGTLVTNSAADPYHATTLDGTMVDYQNNSQVLYLALSGQTNFIDNPGAGVKSYMSFKRNQVADAGSGSYVQDPWGYSYGYSTGTTNNAPAPSYPYNGAGFFDLWSTGGVLQPKLAATPSLTNTWVSNWQ